MFNSDMRMWSEAPPRDQQQGSFTPQEFFSEEAADTAAWSQVGGSVVVLQTINRRCCTITEKAPTSGAGRLVSMVSYQRPNFTSTYGGVNVCNSIVF